VSLLTLSRWQFAVTVMFHMTFPAITVGTSILLCVLYGMYWKTQKPVYLQMFRFWRRIFAVGFAIGVVAGIVITFEFGLDWGVFAAKTGPIMGPILGMEVVTAFFVEAGFIGILLYGDGRVRPPTMFAAAVMVSLGTILSSTWIIATIWPRTCFRDSCPSWRRSRVTGLAGTPVTCSSRSPTSATSCARCGSARSGTIPVSPGPAWSPPAWPAGR